MYLLYLYPAAIFRLSLYVSPRPPVIQLRFINNWAFKVVQPLWRLIGYCFKNTAWVRPTPYPYISRDLLLEKNLCQILYFNESSRTKKIYCNKNTIYLFALSRNNVRKLVGVLTEHCALNIHLHTIDLM